MWNFLIGFWDTRSCVEFYACLVSRVGARKCFKSQNTIMTPRLELVIETLDLFMLLVSRISSIFDSCMLVSKQSALVIMIAFTHVLPTSFSTETNHVNLTRNMARFLKRKTQRKDLPRGTLLESTIIIPTGTHCCV